MIKFYVYKNNDDSIFLLSTESKEYNNCSISRRHLKEFIDEENTLISFDEYYFKHKNDIFNIKVDNIIYNVKVKDIISLIKNNEYEKLINNSELLFNIPKSVFMFITYIYLSIINNKCILPDNILNKMYDINRIIDIEAFNRYLSIDDNNIDKFDINNKLESKILSNIPINYNDLEKSIWIYIMLCRTLTYDETYYVKKHSKDEVKKHKDISHLSDISTTNNKVICWEFTQIYAKLLSKIGINYLIHQNLLPPDESLSYGYGHNYLSYRCGKYLVKADANTSVLSNPDLVNAKFFKKINDIRCINDNEESRNEFNRSLQKVYNAIMDVDGKNIDDEKTTNLLKEYFLLTGKLIPITLKDRAEFIIRKVNSTNQIGIDALVYLKNLRSKVYTSDEKQLVFISFVKKENKIIAIITIKKSKREPKYYIYEPGKDLKHISKSNLQLLFDKNILSYINENDTRAIGIIEKNKK